MRPRDRLANFTRPDNRAALVPGVSKAEVRELCDVHDSTVGAPTDRDKTWLTAIGIAVGQISPFSLDLALILARVLSFTLP